MKNALQGWMWLILTILLPSPAFLVSCSDVIMIPSHVQMSSSNFNSGITLSKLNDEFVWLRTEGEYKTVESGRNSWRQTKLTLVSLITTHAKGIFLQVFAKYLAVKILCRTKWYRGGFFLATTIFVFLPLERKRHWQWRQQVIHKQRKILPVYKTAFFMLLSNDVRHCN